MLAKVSSRAGGAWRLAADALERLSCTEGVMEFTAIDGETVNAGLASIC